MLLLWFGYTRTEPFTMQSSSVYFEISNAPTNDINYMYYSDLQEGGFQQNSRINAHGFHPQTLSTILSMVFFEATLLPISDFCP